tara:strand:- start:598 stop:864 length:267 start_codon:yes stop_codon:yes gene_type:complete
MKELTLYQATQRAYALAQKTKHDHHVVGQRINGDYHIVVMSETDFYPYTRLKPATSLHNILRTKRVNWALWKRDANQGLACDKEEAQA